MTVFNESHVGRRVVEHYTNEEGVIVEFTSRAVLAVNVDFDNGTFGAFTEKGEDLASIGAVVISLVEKGD